MGGSPYVSIRRVRHLTLRNKRGLKNHHPENGVPAVSKGPRHYPFTPKVLPASLKNPTCFCLQFGFKISHFQRKEGAGYLLRRGWVALLSLLCSRGGGGGEAAQRKGELQAGVGAGLQNYLALTLADPSISMGYQGCQLQKALL